MAMEGLTEKEAFGKRCEESERLSYNVFGEEHSRKNCSMARVKWNLQNREPSLVPRA